MNCDNPIMMMTIMVAILVILGMMCACHGNEAATTSLLASRKRLQAEKVL